MVLEYWSSYKFGECMVGLNYVTETGLLDPEYAQIIKERFRKCGEVNQYQLESKNYNIKMVMDSELYRFARIGSLSSEFIWLLIEPDIKMKNAIKEAILLEVRLFEKQKRLEYENN
ncbi:hypothetical protein [Falseniella ignava]|nr:hypothetical protein [Falseniella ignava]